MLDTFRAQLATIKERDPAARGSLEILLCYPGLHALALHRLSNRLWRLELPLLPRLISQFGRWITGIEIHPGARIGKGVFIDHGMGVVIGETGVVGDNCLLYQGMTLGGTGKVHGMGTPPWKKTWLWEPAPRCLGRSPWEPTPVSARARYCCAMWPPTPRWWGSRGG